MPHISPGKMVLRLEPIVAAIMQAEFPTARYDRIQDEPGRPWRVDWRLAAMPSGGVQLRLFHRDLADAPQDCRRFRTLLAVDEYPQWREFVNQRAREEIALMKGEVEVRSWAVPRGTEEQAVPTAA